MFKSIFKRVNAGRERERRERGSSVAPAFAPTPAASQAEPATRLHVTIDETMVALSRELCGLARIEAGQAAKERGWAKLQRELERHPVRPAASVVVKNAGAKAPVRMGAGAPARGLYTGGRRWVLGSAAAMVAVVAVLLGTYSAGLLTAGGDEPTGTVTSVVVSETTVPTTPTTQTPSTTGGPVTTDSTPPTTQGPVTTQPPRTTTTGEQQVVAAQLEKTAKSAVFSLAGMVIDYFVSGDMSGARALVAPAAQSSLVQMVSSLSDPDGYRWVSTRQLSLDTVRITLEFSDRVSNAQGELVEVARRFALTVHVDEESAVITAISAGS